MTLLTLTMTPGGVDIILLELFAVPKKPYFDPEILSLVRIEGILSQYSS